jgi:hypothetical protein
LTLLVLQAKLTVITFLPPAGGGLWLHSSLGPNDLTPSSDGRQHYGG